MFVLFPSCFRPGFTRGQHTAERVEPVGLPGSPAIRGDKGAFPDEGGSRQSADSLAAMRAALEQTYEAILCTNSWRATKAPTRRSRRSLKANANDQGFLSASVEP